MDGCYQLDPLPIIDSATRFTKNMYQKNIYMSILSPQKTFANWKRRNDITWFKKHNWLKKARYDGRDLKVEYSKDNFKTEGWHMYMTPEQAYFGLLLLKNLKM